MERPPRDSQRPNTDARDGASPSNDSGASSSERHVPFVPPNIRQGHQLLTPSGHEIHIDSPRPSVLNLPDANIDEEEIGSNPEEKLNNLKKFAKEAVEATHIAMDSDEQNQKSVAFGQYNVAVGMLDRTISYTKSWEFPEEQKQAVALTRSNLERNRDNIIERMRVLQAEFGRQDCISYLHGPPVNPLPSTGSGTRIPPSYVDSCLPTTPTSPLAGILDGGQVVGNEVFSIPNNIQIYYISQREDNVSAPSYPSFLRIVVMPPEEGHEQAPSTSAQMERTTTSHPPAFLQVGDWTYPLIPGQSPVYKASFGSYIFPDLTSEGSSIGLIFPSEITDAQRVMFDDTLLQLLGLQQFPSPTMFQEPDEATLKDAVERLQAGSAASDAGEGEHPETTPVAAARRSSENLEPREYNYLGSFASLIIGGAEFVAQGFVYGAHKSSDYINAGANYLINRINPLAAQPVIKPEVKKSVQTAKNITGKAVQISGFLVSQVGRGTMLLGRTLAPYIQSTTAKVVAKTTDRTDEEARRTVNGSFEIAGACLIGIGTVYMGLEEAAKIMARAVGNSTVRIIDKRYGEHAGHLAYDTVETLGNAATAGYNVHCLGPKSIAKRIVKDAGMQSVLERAEQREADLALANADMANSASPQPLPRHRHSQSDSALSSRQQHSVPPPRPPPPTPTSRKHL